MEKGDEIFFEGERYTIVDILRQIIKSPSSDVLLEDSEGITVLVHHSELEGD